MSVRFQPVPLIGTSGDLRADIHELVTSEPLRALIAAFGGDADVLLAGSSTDLAATLGLLDAFTDKWDTRQGKERNLASELPLTDAQAALVLGAASALGLRDVRPPKHRDYDHVLLLGGMMRACLTRPGYAAHLIRTGKIRSSTVTALGGHRPFAGDEFDLAAKAGHPGLQEEYEALDLGVRLAFDLGEPAYVKGEESELIGGTWGVRGYHTNDSTNGDITIAVAAAPSSDPHNRRANTPDTYAWFAKHLHRLEAGQRVLMVTTPIYVPAQHAAALRMLALPYGVEVETLGNDPELVPPALAQPFSPTKYLLEVRSMIRAVRSLLTAMQT